MRLLAVASLGTVFACNTPSVQPAISATGLESVVVSALTEDPITRAILRSVWQSALDAHCNEVVAIGVLDAETAIAFSARRALDSARLREWDDLDVFPNMHSEQYEAFRRLNVMAVNEECSGVLEGTAVIQPSKTFLIGRPMLSTRSQILVPMVLLTNTDIEWILYSCSIGSQADQVTIEAITLILIGERSRDNRGELNVIIRGVRPSCES